MHSRGPRQNLAAGALIAPEHLSCLWLDPLCVCAPHPPPPAGDVVRTEVRLVLCYRGWEYTILKRDATHTDPGPEQAIRLMVNSWAGVSREG